MGRSVIGRFSRHGRLVFGRCLGAQSLKHKARIEQSTHPGYPRSECGCLQVWGKGR